MKTFIVEAVLQAGVEDVFAVCWADDAFKVKLHQRNSSADVNVSAWFPQGKEFRRVCFYTIAYGQGGTRCLETQRYQQQKELGGYVIHCAVVPEAAAGQALRVECVWELRAGRRAHQEGAPEEDVTEVKVQGEVECGGGRMWGAAALVEAALLGPARDATHQLLQLAQEALDARVATKPTSTTSTTSSTSSSSTAPVARWHEFRLVPSSFAPMIGFSFAASLACSTSPALITACSPSSLCPSALRTLLALSGTTPRDSQGRTALHVVCGACSPANEPLRLAALRTLLAANADVTATDDLGNMPLHVAASSSAGVVAAALLACGAPLQSRNNAGRTPMQLARDAPACPAQMHTIDILKRGAPD